jgi:hypothetical protein
MTFEEMFEDMIGVKPAEINGKIIDVAGNSEIELSGRRIDLITLSIQIARDVIEKSDIDVDVYCRTLKKASNNCRDDLKPDQKTESISISEDSELIVQVISLIASYAIDNEMDPNETIETVAEFLLSLLKITTFENWKKKEDLDDK